MTGWNMMRNTEGICKALYRKAERIQSPLAPSMTMPKPQVIMPQWKTSPLWVSRRSTSQKPWKRQCTLGSMIQPSIGTLVHSSWSTYWMQSFSIPLISISSRPFHYSSCTVHVAHITLGDQGCKGCTACVNISQHWIGMWSVPTSRFHTIWHQVPLIAQPMVPTVVSIIKVGTTLSSDLMKPCRFS